MKLSVDTGTVKTEIREAVLIDRPGVLYNRLFERAALALIVVAAAALRFLNIDSLGYVNHYYSAAMVSMLKSWHNFFFLAAEPGAAVSVDKPPIGLWIQAASAAVFGVNSFGVLLPSILAGLASIVVLYHLVRRSFGAAAGLVAALALALTPIVIATDRNNTIDSLLILALLLAAWGFIKAAETGRTRFLLWGAAAVGVGFNIKMLAAFLPLPAFYGIYLLGSSEQFARKLKKLLLATALLAVISLSWVTVVDLVPANQRPFIGSSGDNNEMSLIAGYNGVERLMGMFGSGRRGASSGFGPSSGSFRARNFPPIGSTPNFQARPRTGTTASGFTFSGGNSGTASGSVDMGSTGPLRLLLPPLSKNASWLLPLALAALALLLVGGRWRLPLSKERQAAVLWGGWLLTAAVFFSAANFFHEYYLSILGPPLAALVGIGAATILALREERPRLAALLLPVAAALTLAFQVLTASPYVYATLWLPAALLLLAVGAGLWLAARSSAHFLRAGFACILASVLVAPGVWSVFTNLYPSENQSLPSVYAGQSGAFPDLRGLNVNPSLLAYLQANTPPGSYLLAVPSSMQGSDYVIATGRPVLYLGGFMGIDPVVTSADLARMTQQGKLRFIYATNGSGQGGGFGSRDQPGIFSWVDANCRVVPGFDALTQNSGAPGGIGGTTGPNSRTVSRGFGQMEVSLYDCGRNQ